MKNARSFAVGWMSFAAVIVLIGWFSGSPVPAAAQSAGQNGAYDSSGNCSPCQGSPSFVDASVFYNKPSSKDFCSVLNWVLNPSNGVLSSTSAVIDARGLPGSYGTSMTCTVSPWAGISQPPAATILLPAGKIVIPGGWVLPANTRLIGVGNGDVANSSGATYSGTTIQACKSGQTGCGPSLTGTMISMCSSACSGVSIENLSLDGQGLTSINGIANGYATSGYVKNIAWGWPILSPTKKAGALPFRVLCETAGL
jgi:hypothetical protein